METPGAVTFCDSFIKEFEGSKKQKTRCFVLILHELAHQWFGNLVTMKWWDDLWLNEGFADFASFTALEVINPPGIERPMNLLLNDKINYAYTSDLSMKTHPIRCQVSDTDEADEIFDDITYTKSVCSIIQLFNLVGKEIFCSAIKNYFERYSWKNVTYREFLGTFKEFISQKANLSIEDIDNWEKDWFNQSASQMSK